MKISHSASRRLRNLLRAAMLAGAGIVIAGATSTPAHAVDATWNGTTTNYNLGTNWSGGVVPDNLATFSGSVPSNPTTTASATINELNFSAGARSYTFTNGAGLTYNVNGIGTLGIVNNSSNLQTFINNGSFILNNNASISGGAAGVLFNNNGTAAVAFATAGADDTGVAGTDSTATGNNASMVFNGNTSAGNATVTLNNNAGNDTGFAAAGGNGGATGNGGNGGSATTTGGTAQTTFNSNSNAGSATLNNNASIGAGNGGNGGNGGTVGNGGNGGGAVVLGGTAVTSFKDNSSAASSTIHNNAGNDTSFGGTGGTGSTGDGGNGGGATTFGGTAQTTFSNSSSAGNATITNTGGDGTAFGGNGGGGGGTTGAGGNGGGAVAFGGSAVTSFIDTAHAGSATITNTGGDSTAFGGGGGGGATGAGGNGGSAIAIGGSAVTAFNDNSHADTATITNTSGTNSNSNGAAGGSGGGGGAGGNGGSTTALSGSAQTNFNDTSHADSANITNNLGGLTNFNDTSSAVSATITNNAGGATTFDDSSSGGADPNHRAHINNTGGNTTFQNSSPAATPATAGFAAINNTNGGNTTFADDTNAGNALITNGGTGTGSTDFNGTSSAAHAIISNDTGGRTNINQAASGGNATINNLSGGSLYVYGTGDNSGLTVSNNIGGKTDISGNTGTGTSIGSMFGAGNVFLGSKTLTLGALNSSNDEISGVIQDGGTGGGTGGSLVKTGTGVLTLSNTNNSYTGPTEISQGTLNLTGDITSDTTVDFGGTLTGDGFIGIPFGSVNTLTNNGTLDPGSTTGQPLSTPGASLFVLGDYTNNANSTFISRVEGNGATLADSNSLIGDSNIILNGGDVRALVHSPNANGFGPNGFGIQTEALLTGTLSGTLTGTFTGIDQLNSTIPTYLDASIEYDPNAAILVLRRNTLGLNSMGGLSFNQRSVGRVLDANIGTADPAFFDLFNSVLLSNNQRRALDKISGDALTAFPIATQDAALRFNDRMLARVLAHGGNVKIALVPISSRMAYEGTRYKTLLADNMNGTASSQRTQMQDALEMQRSNLWATLAGAHDKADSDGNGPGFSAHATEYQIGYDRAVSTHTVVGVSIGRSNGRLNVDDRNADGDFDTTSFGLYASHDSGAQNALFWNAQASYNRHSIHSTRDLVGTDARADYHGRTLALQGEVGKRYGKGKYSIEPNLTFKINNTSQDSFDEHGGAGALRSDADNYNTRRLGIGVRFVNRNPNARIRPHLALSYEHEFGDTQSELSNQLIGLGSNFTVRGTDLGSNIFRASLGADARLNDRFSLTGEIGASRRSNQQSEYIYGGVRYGF